MPSYQSKPCTIIRIAKDGDDGYVKNGGRQYLISSEGKEIVVSVGDIRGAPKE